MLKKGITVIESQIDFNLPLFNMAGQIFDNQELHAVFRGV